MKVETSISKSVPATIENVLPFYLQKASAGQRVCLVTLYQVDTVAPRPEGSQIAVAEDGEHFGFITGGCAEAAIVHEALLALKENCPRKIRIGSESPWFDIKLPCGAGIDLHFSVADSTAPVRTACELLARRKPVSLELDLENDVLVIDGEDSRLRNAPKFFVRHYIPQTRLAILGAGPYVDSLTGIAVQSGYQVLVWSPETVEPSVTPAASLTPRKALSRTMPFPSGDFDAWTAAVLLFHEHDWEPKLIRSVLATDCFYIGALGSRKTHASRLQQLRKLCVAESQLNRIHGPVGLPINARTPAEISISILAEVIAAKNSDAIVQRQR